MNMSNEKDPLLPGNTTIQKNEHYNSFPSLNDEDETKVIGGSSVNTYHRRWYILTLFSFLAFTQASSWNTWGPIADTTKAVLKWTDGDIALLTNWGCIMFLLTAVFFSWLLDVKGLRWAILTSATILQIGLITRCIPVGIDNIKWTMNIGHICIGIAGPVLMSAPTLISATWFPPTQRTTSTALTSSAAYLGIAGSFLIGPVIVTDIKTINQTDVNETAFTYTDNGFDISEATRHEHFQEIMKLMYIECAFGAILFLCALIYFPAKPPLPPSVSASTVREDFVKGLKRVIKNPQVWILSLSYSITTGLFNSWNTQFDTIFSNTVNVQQDVTGWIGFFSNIAGTVGGLVVGRCVDFMGGRMKIVLLILTTLSAGFYIWVVCICSKYIIFELWQLYFAIVAGAFLVSSSVPVYFELMVETAYPVGEGTTTMFQAILNNLVALIFLFIPMIPNLGVLWMNWAMFGACFICIPLLIVFKENYQRLKMDLK
ncbi:solute carrier family 49 member 4-like [Anneissia japonica]|uniref:solute carrier family 49 member 4-like n=1 Tax=Anneissia japonica TaxID=1529436 RepID=UPI0014257EA7|nr:solute carrier family 49 member 4-like [Anneissia japonica]XP_033109467.1 solute carrier family 49 member 4-like [Anneissia japonica]XP_033109468.1 solute carrier family 49 member 4-like [Anneissia japonica]XP_033109469.1 solute carrier family 49 member 4-like [Anneissia japonica]